MGRTIPLIKQGILSLSVFGAMNCYLSVVMLENYLSLFSSPWNSKTIDPCVPLDFTKDYKIIRVRD